MEHKKYTVRASVSRVTIVAAIAPIGAPIGTTGIDTTQYFHASVVIADFLMNQNFYDFFTKK